MSTSSPRCLTFILGLCFVLAGIGVDRAEPEKIPRDKVIHPLLEGVSQPELISEPRKNPIYPEKWRKLHLGARVILQGVIEKTGSVGDRTDQN